MAKITYTDKVALNTDNTIPAINKGMADDFNEIKTVVNQNDDDFTAATSDSGWLNITPAQGTAGTGYYVPAYRKIGKCVYLKGFVNGVTTRASEVFTLPNGYYNTTNRYSFCTTNDNTEINYVRITNAGVVQIQQSTGTFSNGVNLCLDGIVFMID